jgi:hypothetical protein
LLLFYLIDCNGTSFKCLAIESNSAEYGKQIGRSTDGGVEGWRDGGVEGWRGGGVEWWRDGVVEGWRDGGVDSNPPILHLR